MRILYTKRHRLDEQREATLGVEYRSLDDLLKESDFVSINAVLSPETVHLIGYRELSLMRPSAYLVNTARGPIVDEKALVRALEEKRIAGAALDVYEREPMVEPGLINLPNVGLNASPRKRRARYARADRGHPGRQYHRRNRRAAGHRIFTIRRSTTKDKGRRRKDEFILHPLSFGF